MTAPATAPIGPSTTAPDKAPNAASPPRSPAIAVEDISARESATLAIVFFIRVSPLCRTKQIQFRRLTPLIEYDPARGQMMSPGRIFENRGAAATLLELSEQRRNRAKNPADVGAPAGLDFILPSQPLGVNRCPPAGAPSRPSSSALLLSPSLPF